MPPFSLGSGQARGERAIFRGLAKTCGIPIRLKSIRSRPEPEPDIRCTVGSKGAVAFELGEIVGQAFPETTKQRKPLRQKFSETYAKLAEFVRSRIEVRLNGPPEVFVAFPEGTSPGKWQRTIPSILAVLTEGAEGEVPVWRIKTLKQMLTEMIIRGGSGCDASLHVIEMTEQINATLMSLVK